MRIVAVILAASLGLALFKAALAVLMACYGLLLLVAVLMKPAETFGALIFFLLCFMLQEHAVATLATFVALYAIGAIFKSREDR